MMIMVELWEFDSGWELTSEATAHLPNHSFLVTPSPEMILRKMSQGDIYQVFRKTGAGMEFVLLFGTYSDCLDRSSPLV
jgi:hypothetical protein